ncbi:hypothetical protein [Pseudomonas chlororaphis]|uniref:hypothetical protein n=1 Tax=Pseudomonas chlororaphis TaxID=587753 RepID=UPI000F574E05|nr:hypothetical protein [Pseudomonas chlororaphis]QIT24271.1 hypothetical protein HCN09_22020 [Pseudomonas chlororaphis subsp. aurantiaca]WDH02386.1 hypothetical protein PUP57_23155 [Pseudomonas chlororaphis]WDH08766.1 hypothetical protein PUP64_23855 [Pseudomonas chlororaphis]
MDALLAQERRPDGTIACQVASGASKAVPASEELFPIKNLDWPKGPRLPEHQVKTGKSAQLFAQHCARSCALLCTY